MQWQQQCVNNCRAQATTIQSTFCSIQCQIHSTRCIKSFVCAEVNNRCVTRVIPLAIVQCNSWMVSTWWRITVMQYHSAKPVHSLYTSEQHFINLNIGITCATSANTLWLHYSKRRTVSFQGWVFRLKLSDEDSQDQVSKARCHGNQFWD